MGPPSRNDSNWILVERATGPLWRATRPPRSVRRARGSWIESSRCRSSAASCRRERPGWPFHPNPIESLSRYRDDLAFTSGPRRGLSRPKRFAPGLRPARVRRARSARAPSKTSRPGAQRVSFSERRSPAMPLLSLRSMAAFRRVELWMGCGPATVWLPGFDSFRLRAGMEWALETSLSVE
jgi:hypothetical protein